MNLCSRSRHVLRTVNRPVLTLQYRYLRENENFTFDWSRVPDTLEKERRKYEEYSELMGDSKFSKQDLNIREIEYTASQKPEEWVHVQRLVEMCAPRQIPGGYLFIPHYIHFIHFYAR